MATGGRSGDSSDDGLDLRELESELKDLEKDELNTTNESLLWEEHKAQTGYEKLEKLQLLGNLIFQLTLNKLLPLKMISPNINL